MSAPVVRGMVVAVALWDESSIIAELPNDLKTVIAQYTDAIYSRVEALLSPEEISWLAATRECVSFTGFGYTCETHHWRKTDIAEVITARSFVEKAMYRVGAYKPSRTSRGLHGRISTCSPMISDALIRRPAANVPKFATHVDIHTMFLVLQQRFKLLDLPSPDVLARKRTRIYLDEIFECFEYCPISLELYLESCIVNLGMDAEKRENGNLDQAAFGRINERCARYRTQLLQTLH